MLAADDRVAIALSGGSDSVALTWLLHDMATTSDWTVAGLVHVHHGLRGAESDADEAFCRTLAARLALPIDVTRIDILSRSRAARASVEVAAREARYEVFPEAARRLGATCVATGHTMDDQAETVLLRLLRGATARGISAIRARRDRYVRPLLDFRRQELRADLIRRGEGFREDASNADIRIVRNRLRHQLMPVVQELAPGAVRALARLAELSTEDEAFLTSSARAHATLLGLLRNDADGVQLDRGRLNALPGALARRVVRDAIEAADAPVTSRHIEDVLRLTRGRRLHGHLDLTGLAVEIDNGSLILRRRATGITPVPGFEYALTVPGAVEISETCGRVEASYREVVGADRGLCGAAVAILQASALHLPLVVRNRRPGDRLRPLGAPGSRKLQDVLVDRKVARESRDTVPIVADASGTIVWVAGVTVADHCRVTAPEAGVVILKFKGPRD